MKCIYDLKFILSYNENLLSLEECQKFKEHLEACKKCQEIIQKDKSLKSYFKSEPVHSSYYTAKRNVMNNIPFGKYKNKSIRLKLQYLFNGVLQNNSYILKGGLILLLAFVVFTNIDKISQIRATTSNIKDKILSDNKEPTISNSQIKLTDEKPYSNTLVESGSKNILLVGEDKYNHFDIISVVSINEKTNSLKVISIPEDLYIKYSQNLKLPEDMSLKSFNRIRYANILYSSLTNKKDLAPDSMVFLSKTIEEKFNIPIENYIKITTEGFASIIDLFGGVYIDVPYNMKYDDLSQGLSIDLKKGRQLLDGKKASQFIRYRKSNQPDHESINRNENYINFMKEFISQHGTVKSIDKLPQSWNIMKNYIVHNIDTEDTLNYFNNLLKNVFSKEYETEYIPITGRAEILDGIFCIIVD